MKVYQARYWFLGLLLTAVVATGGSGMLSLAYAQKVPPATDKDKKDPPATDKDKKVTPPPKPAFETIIEPGEGAGVAGVSKSGHKRELVDIIKDIEKGKDKDKTKNTGK